MPAASSGSDLSRLAVAFDATPLLGARTGIGAFCAGAVDSLSRRDDVAVTAFAVSWRGRDDLARQLPAGVRASSRPMAARPLHWSWRRLGRPVVERFVGRCDVVHGTNFVVPPARHAARVVTVHDLTPVRFPEMCDAPTLAFADDVRRAVADGAWVHTPSRFVADEVLAEMGASPERVRPVAHGVPALPVPLDSAVPPTVTGRIVLAVGTVEPRKDYPGLVAAFEYVAAARPDATLVIAGRDGWGAAALDRVLSRSPVAGRVVRLGYLDDATLAAVLGRASVLVYPSVYEGFGFPPLQAMGAGVPVVATAAGAVPEVVGDAAVLVDPADTDALAAALSSVLADEDLRTRLVAAGRSRAASFSWEACAAGLVSLYADAASELG